MNNPKSRQEWIFDLLISEPTLSNGDCFTRYLQKFTKSRQTFQKDWNKAQERFKEYIKAVNKAKLEESIKLEKESLKRDILSKHQAMEILTKIAKGNAARFEGKVSIPSASERTKAISELAKFDGWYEPEKHDHTTGGEKLQPLLPFAYKDNWDDDK